jgi:AcrR family transcriptional regulator
VSSPRTRTAGPFLDRATLVAAAADLADAEGWNELTLSRVAEVVDRHVSSLYTHVDGLDGLRLAVATLAVDEVADAVWRAVLGRTGADALEQIAIVERDFARAHPGRIAAVRDFTGTSDPEFRVRARRLAEPIRATLASFGLDATQVAIAHTVFSSAIRGLISTERTTPAQRRDTDLALNETVALFVAALESGAWPKTRD